MCAHTHSNMLMTDGEAAGARWCRKDVTHEGKGGQREAERPSTGFDRHDPGQVSLCLFPQLNSKHQDLNKL